MLKQLDRTEFIAVMGKEIDTHERRGHWELCKKSDVPDGMKTIMSLWAFKRKRLPSGDLLKHKARLCAHGGQQQWGINYWETYAPVANWASVRLLLALSHIHGLESKSIDFVLAFPQAVLDTEVYMEIPQGFERHIDGHTHVLLLKRSIYGLKQSNYNFYQKLTKALKSRGINPCSTDSCVFASKNLIILVYVDDVLIFSKKKLWIDMFIKSLAEGEENFELTDEGSIDKYLGVEIQTHSDGSYELKQPYLTQRILQELNLSAVDTQKRPTPVATPLLHKDLQGHARVKSWNYRSVIGMLTYLQGISRPDISMAVHQCARFSAYPKLNHERAVTRIGRYLIDTVGRGLVCKVDRSKGLECFVDADFAGGWNSDDPLNPENVLSRTGFVIMYADVPVFWRSKLQTEIALSTCEAEYIALSAAMREVIPLIQLLEDLKVACDIITSPPIVTCRVFEDNQSCIAVAESKKPPTRTKHIAIKYHHFRSLVENDTIKINYIDTKKQLADILTKPVENSQFFKLRFMLMGW